MNWLVLIGIVTVNLFKMHLRVTRGSDLGLFWRWGDIFVYMESLYVYDDVL